MKKIILISASFLLILASNVFAESASDWLFGAQVRIRTEIDGRDFSNRSRALNFTSMRSRFTASKNFNDAVKIFFQAQDSRVFGNEPNTLGSTANLDIHQAYVTLKNPLGIPMTAQLGRFEVIYGTERFFGAVGWSYVARSFDGARFSFNPLGLKVDVFALTRINPQKYIGIATPPDTLLPDNSFSIYGFWATKNFNKNNSLHLFGFYEANRLKSDGINPDLSAATFGVNHFCSIGNLNTIFEAAYTTGSKGSKDLAAYLISLQAAYKLGSFSIGAGADILSGTPVNETNKYNSFSTSYATNHKFYGFMDYFVSVPQNTNDLGLRDFYGRLKYTPKESKFKYALDFHLFNSSEKNSNGDNNFGQEIDFTTTYNFVKSVAITWGGSVFLQGELMKDKFGMDNTDPAFWTYIMITANIK